MATRLDLIVRLHTVENELEGVRARLGGIPDWMAELHEEHSAKKAELDAARATIDEAESERRRLEAELEDSQEKLRHFQSQISQISTQREYGALLKEIDTVKGMISELEKAALEAMETVETTREASVGLESEFAEIDQRYSAELEKWEAQKPAVQVDEERLANEARTLRGEIPKAFLVLYGRLRERYGPQAVAKVLVAQGARGGNTMWHCDACSYNVRPQTVVEIRNEGRISQCDSCKRILRWDDSSE